MRQIGASTAMMPTFRRAVKDILLELSLKII